MTHRRVCVYGPRAALVAIGVAAAIACGAPDETAERAGDANVPGANVRGGEWLEGIPLYPQAEAVNRATSKDGARAQSFMTDRVGRRELMRWYERELLRNGWRPIEPAHSIGENTWRGRWRREGAELIVSATTGPESDAPRGVDNVTQFSLVLEGSVQE